MSWRLRKKHHGAEPSGELRGEQEHPTGAGRGNQVPFGSCHRSALRATKPIISAPAAQGSAARASTGPIEAQVFLAHALRPPNYRNSLSADRFSIGRVDPAQSPRRIDSPCRYATSARALSSGTVQLPIGCCTIKNG